ncbi:dihydroorotate dehydrogenase-like protein [Thiobacillus denitrificans]|jgi:dihydroorotate dehydrogenase (fumarate)|uniref:dihydroorotate dehydrogenase-like protein n=1 Tax=Thiobacillus denitrificans TaxID=36861 RepID=UPI000378820B|nr:dihydroorotate dehydrogenase-like protein [Thiobacillus denitrificans]
MIDLSTDYLGLKLKNPLVPSASPLSRNLDTALRLEDAGAAALVMYSLFEEELRAEDAMMDRFLLHAGLGSCEAEDGFLPDHGEFRSSLDHYLAHLHQLKCRLEIPVVASLNGISPSGWVELGHELQQAGADALELNVYHVAAEMMEPGEAVEARYLKLLTELRQVVSVPIVMKLSPFFSSLPHFVKQLELAGANGVALFNRFYQPDIDLDKLYVVDRLHLSLPEEALLRIRWLSILHGRTPLTLAATGGVHSHEEAMKLLLVGADVVHLASCLLQHGPGRLTQILHAMEGWMAEREYASVAQLKGSMSQKNLYDPSAMARDSYLRVLDSFSPRPGVWS